MNMLTVLAAGMVFVFWAGYRGALRFPNGAALLAIALLIGSGRLMTLDLGASSLGDGAPSSAGAFLGLLWLMEGLCTVLAGMLLLVGWRARDQVLPKTLFLVLYLPFAGYVAFSAWPHAKRPTAQAATPGVASTPGPTGSRKDGYLWALDSNFLSDGECQGASPDFVAGCKEGVAKNLARQSQ
jgi:hypothetical protein